MNELKHKKAFTLVELIIVITILVILATIAFVSFQNYTKDSRDANRLTTINNISKGLDIFQIKTGFYPEPESKTSFTGAGDKKLHQGIISDNITNTINLSEIPLDPKEKTNYIYSTYGDGKYYQIASEAENITSFLYNTTYAENKSSIVRGNYKFDPSLPSLIVITNSLTGSSIFDPKVCFVTNGGLNSITSNSGTCLKKEEMSLNTIDNSLVGYWDMESLCQNGNCGVGNDGKLKDLSGNENHGSFSGISNFPSLTGGYLGKGLKFSNIGSGNSIIIKSDILNKDIKELSIQVISKSINNNKYMNIISKSSYSYTGASLYPDAPFKLDFGLDFNPRFYTTPLIPLSINDYALIESKNSIDNNLYQIYSGIFNNGTVEFYINGLLIGKSKMLNNYIKGIDSYLRLGHGNGIGGNSGVNCPTIIDGITKTNCFGGIIDEVKIYNRALTDQEIAQQARIAGF